MPVDAAHHGMPVAQVAADTGHDPDRDGSIDQHRTLLDVQLNEALHLGGVDRPLARAYPLRVEPLLDEVSGQRASAVEAPHGVERGRRQQPEGRTAADVVRGEPGHLICADRHGDNVAARRPPEAAQAHQDAERCEEAGCPIEIAAVRHGIEMRAGHHHGKLALPSG